MSETEKLLADVPAEDPHFVMGVMARIEQRRFRRELGRTGGLAVAAMALLALVMPQLTMVMPALDIDWLGDFVQQNQITIAVLLTAVTILLPRLSRI